MIKEEKKLHIRQTKLIHNAKIHPRFDFYQEKIIIILHYNQFFRFYILFLHYFQKPKLGAVNRGIKKKNSLQQTEQRITFNLVKKKKRFKQIHTFSPIPTGKKKTMSHFSNQKIPR